jgi:CubicO group peptidase (beta-lactamase class C family)
MVNRQRISRIPVRRRTIRRRISRHLAVYHRGRLVLDDVVGLADTQRGVPVRADTLFALRSAGKPFASVALLQLAERGQLRVEAPVATCWPQFAKHGKEAVTIEHVLTHRGGFADGLGGLEPERWLDEEAVARALEELPLRFPPGTASSYSQVAQQWVCAEIVRRVDGRPFPVYLREEITVPLGMTNTHVALPPELDARVARTHLTEATTPENFDAVLMNRRGAHRLLTSVFGVSTARHGTVLVWGDPNLQLAMAYLTNGFRPARYALATVTADARR